MATVHVPSNNEPMDRVDAAHLLLGVSPNTVTDSVFATEQHILSKQDPVIMATPTQRPRSNSSGLDALAALATSSLEKVPIVIPAGNSSASSSSDEEDSEQMPPPPPRRMRSCSNPEGMEKWDTNRPRFMLPASILEEELKSAKEAADAHQLKQQQEPHVAEELLRKARARLLEDVTEETITAGQKGGMLLPHSLQKYEHVYNKNGRIGIYSPSERAAIIARFHRKRSRRVWNKKIRYGCRKDLADRRLRVKGRFVKRVAPVKPADEDMPDVNDPEAGFAPTADQPYRRLRRHTIT